MTTRCHCFLAVLVHRSLADGTAYTQGLQQYTGSEKVVQAVVTLKHFLAYSIESYKGVERYNVDVKISAYDMSHTYTPAWETLVKTGKALGVMCSYNVRAMARCGCTNNS